MRHQNKPVAAITYLNNKGKNILVDESHDDWHSSLQFTLKEIAIFQTALNRAFFNCNCDLNKDILESILGKVKECLKCVDHKHEG